MDQNTLKQQAAKAALTYIQDNTIVGVGSGSTVNYFIDELAKEKHRIEGVIASSESTAARLKQHHIPIFDLNAVDEVPVYIDGADEISPLMQMIKGGGGALTREKIVATAAKQFICIADSSKWVKALGDFPIAIEVIPMARSLVARELVKMFKADPVYRDNVTTDNGNIILDVYNLSLREPIELERQLNQITGVVCHGLFATCMADILLLAAQDGVKTIKG